MNNWYFLSAGCLLRGPPEEHGGHHGGEGRQDWREGEVTVVCCVWTDLLFDYFRRDKYLSSAMVEGDTAESYIAQVNRRLEHVENGKFSGPEDLLKISFFVFYWSRPDQVFKGF